MSGTGVPTCACGPTHQVFCTCGVFGCSNCGAASRYTVAGLGQLDGSYFGNPSQNPLCTNCRGCPELDPRYWALRTEQMQRQSYPPSILTQPRVTTAQSVPENEPRRTRAGQPRDKQQPEGSEQLDRILSISRQSRGISLTDRTRESNENSTHRNQGAGASLRTEMQSWFRLSGEEPNRPTRTAGESTTQGDERGPPSTVERQPRIPQSEEEQPTETTKRARRMARYEVYVRIAQEAQRQRDREREHREEQLRRRRELELRIQNVQAFLEEQVMRIEARHQYIWADPERRESFERAELPKLLKHRQKQERLRHGSRSQTTTKGDKTAKETSKECTICAETYADAQDSFPFPPTLRECSEHHDMDVCVLCLCHNIKSQLESRGSAACNDLRCPNLGCDHVYTHTQVNFLADPNTFALYDQYCLNTNLVMEPNFRRCLRGRCTNGQIYDDLDPDSPNGNRILCSVCSFVMCFKHHCPWHQGLTCDEYDLRRKDDDEETESWLAEKTKSCPNCNIPIEKGTGCFHMTCRACRYEFCWECLADWRTARSGPGGHRSDCFFRKRAVPPPTAMLGSTIVEAERSREIHRERVAQMRARIDGLLEP